MEQKENLQVILKKFNLKAVSEETGINYSTLRSYVVGDRRLSKDRREVVVKYLKDLLETTL